MSARKLDLSRDYPRESRLFANEILQGAPRIAISDRGRIARPCSGKVRRAAAAGWTEGRIAQVHPVHLIFSIWALTQHYADFEVQVRAVLGDEGQDPYPEAGHYLETLFRKLLTV